MTDKVCFGVYELDRDARELRKRGALIRLQDQPLRVLAILTGRPGEIVTRQELQAQIWGKETFVDFDHSLNKAVNRIREALNDDARTPQYIKTIPRRGYRFIASVEIHVKHDAPTHPVSADTSGAFAHPGNAIELRPVQLSKPVARDVANRCPIRLRIAIIAMVSVLVSAMILAIWLVLATPRCKL